jgi:hypothetical protein
MVESTNNHLPIQIRAGVGLDPTLGRKVPPPAFSRCARDCRLTNHHWCFKRLSGAQRSAEELVDTLEDAKGSPSLVRMGDDSVLLYAFQSADGQGMRLLNLVTHAQCDYPIPSKDFPRVKGHYVGLDDPFLVIDHEDPDPHTGYRQTLTFLTSDLQPSRLPPLSWTADHRVSRIEPLRCEGTICGVIVFHGRYFVVYRWVNGQWQRDVQVNGNPIAIQTRSATQLVDRIDSEKNGLKAKASQWYPTQGFQQLWEMEVPRAAGCHCPDLFSFCVKGQDYLVMISAAQHFRVIRCPNGKEGQDGNTQWSFSSSYICWENADDTAIHASAIGEDILLIVQQTAYAGTQLISTRWLLLQNGKTKQLGRERLWNRPVGALGVAQIGQSRAEYLYERDSKRLLRVELGEGKPAGVKVRPPLRRRRGTKAGPVAVDNAMPERSGTSWAGFKGMTLLLSLYLTARHIQSKVAELYGVGYSPWVSWAQGAVLGAVVFPLAGIVSREAQERYLSKSQQWIPLLPFTGLAGLVLYGTRGQPLLCASWAWGLASSFTWNRTWSVDAN